MIAAVATLRIGDWDAAKRFYVDGLGFAVDWEWHEGSDGPLFVQVSRGPLRFYLSRRAGDGSPGGLVYLYVADVDDWQAELLGRGILAEGPPVDQAWGNRELRVCDPDGNQLCICAVIADPEPGESS